MLVKVSVIPAFGVFAGQFRRGEGAGAICFEADSKDGFGCYCLQKKNGQAAVSERRKGREPPRKWAGSSRKSLPMKLPEHCRISGAESKERHDEKGDALYLSASMRPLYRGRINAFSELLHKKFLCFLQLRCCRALYGATSTRRPKSVGISAAP